MKITKILNNNVAVAHDDIGREIIVMGNGLVFGRKIGDILRKDKVEKTFTISDQGVFGRFQKLMENIPMKHLMIAEQVINEARLRMGKRLHDSIYVALPDHISCAILRYQDSIILKNPLLWDIRRFYKDEFLIGLYANEIVEKETGIRFLEDEAAFIAMHFVNAQLGDEISTAYDITYIMQEICTIVREFYAVTFEEDSLDYYRFITHLKFFAQRVKSHVHYEDDSDELLEGIKRKHPDAFECACKVSAYVAGKHSFQLSNDELLYLTVHIARITRDIRMLKH